MSPTPKREPISWKNADPAMLRKVRGVCFDIDDTFSSRGKITPAAFEALWKLKLSGLITVPITGRPAGWCDHIARFWPVNAVVGENGAFTFFMRNGVRSRLDTPQELSRKETKDKIKELGRAILTEFPDARTASDQEYREYDLAIDYCEDVSPWPDFEVERLVQLCKKEGAIAKVSSVHVNAWFGKYDKVSGFKAWLTGGAPGINAEVPKWDEWIFIGDSPNDEPLFEAFSMSVGVANVAPFLEQIQHPPLWVTAEQSGDGFVEMANKLLLLRGGSAH